MRTGAAAKRQALLEPTIMSASGSAVICTPKAGIQRDGAKVIHGIMQAIAIGARRAGTVAA